MTACRSEPLPEAYGVYARTGRALERLEQAPEGPSQHDAGDSAIIVLFDNRLAPGQDLTGQIALMQLAWTRLAVDQIVPRQDAEPSRVTGQRLESWTDFNTAALPVDLQPVEGKQNMLLVKPKLPLRDGIYSVYFFGHSFPFNVGSQAVEVTQRDRCFDAWRTALDKNAGFSWNNWLTQAQNMQAARTAEGHTVLKTDYKPCRVYDEAAPRIAREREQKRAAAENAAAAARQRQAEAEESRQRLLAESKRVTTTLGTFTVFNTDMFGKPEGDGFRLTVTDSSVRGLTLTDPDPRHWTPDNSPYLTGNEADEVWFCHLYNYRAEPIRDGWARIFLEYEKDLFFASDAERDRFVKTLIEAGEAWSAKYPNVYEVSERCSG